MEFLANLASILTAIVAVIFYFGYQYSISKKRRRLEAYLKSEKEEASSGKQGLHTIIHLMAKLGLTEEEILQASFRSKHITRKVAVDPETDRATELLFGYEEKP